ncbi:MAG: 2-amino-4-hydroxy-6-hydroxymethyldihydropteridine diphosphokinase [Thalassobaculaceae bacterium]
MAAREGIYLGIGANLPAVGYDSAAATCQAAIRRLDGLPALTVTAVSRWYRSAPVPVADQPWFINAVLAVETTVPPAALLAELHAVEDQFGRVRQVRNEARVLDIDLLDYRGQVSNAARVGAAAAPILPHPRMDARAFVLLPLRELAPTWRHPVRGLEIDALIAALPADQEIQLDEASATNSTHTGV